MKRKPIKRKARSRPRKGAPSILGGNIKRARESKGFTQLALAQSIGFVGADAGACISRWENGKQAPTIENLSKIAAALGVQVCSLLP